MTSPARFTAAAVLSDLRHLEATMVRLAREAPSDLERSHYRAMAAGVDIALNSARTLVDHLPEAAKP